MGCQNRGNACSNRERPRSDNKVPRRRDNDCRVDCVESKLSKAWKSDKHYVSLYNFLPEVRRGVNLPKKIAIHDVTLRDGEQQARVTFRKDEKVKIARALDEAGVDRIEAGLPSGSPSDTEAIPEITHLGLSAKIYAFSRCMKADVDNAV